jgi:membrane protein DedA with SNARE-associated domain
MSAARYRRRLALVVFVVVTVPTALFAMRTYRSFLFLRSAYAAGAPKTSAIRAWMTIEYVAAIHRVPIGMLLERLGRSPDTRPQTSLKTLADGEGLPPAQYVERAQRAVAAVTLDAGSGQEAEPSGWLRSIGDEILTALLKHGYPILGLTLLLGAIGLPLPDGLATLVAGSLAAQGRMKWLWAGAIAVTASVAGDAVGYAVGRLLGESVVDRHGRWFGYTARRRARVRELFDQWGSLTVLLTRTLVSYLSSVVSLLAGISRYHPAAFLGFAFVGRVLWAVAYLGLGYTIGADLEAAAGFLTNLTGLLLSSALLFGAAAVARGHSLRPARAIR